MITNRVHPLLIKGLEGAGYEVNYDLKVDNTSIRSIINDYHGVIINSKIKADKDLIDKGSNLKFIGRLGSGLEIIDLEYADKIGVRVFNSPEGNRNAVAEHAIGMMLALSNKLISANTQVKNFEWNREEHRGFELGGKTIGIIGFGNTGQSLARKLATWDMTILANDKNLEVFSEEYSQVIISNIKNIQNKCDIISFHLPLTPETKHFCNITFITGCKRAPIIVNTSRGNVVNTSDLLECLEKGLLSGACLDVFENEKPKTYTESEKAIYSQLFSLPQVITSPHVAGWTQESLEKIAQVLLDKILAQNFNVNG